MNAFRCAILALLLLLCACGTLPGRVEVEALEGSGSRWVCVWSQVGGDSGDSHYCEAGPRLFTCVVGAGRVTWSYYVDGYQVDTRDLPTLSSCIDRAEAGAAAGQPPPSTEELP